MTLKDLYAKFAEQQGLTKVQASQYIKGLQDIITEEVKNGGSVTLPGFATFCVKEVAEKTYPIPSKPGETVTKPAHKEMKVRVANALKDI